MLVACDNRSLVVRKFGDSSAVVIAKSKPPGLLQVHDSKNKKAASAINVWSCFLHNMGGETNGYTQFRSAKSPDFVVLEAGLRLAIEAVASELSIWK